MKLCIGNKNYSSWSLRPWLVLEQFGIPFEEEVIPLDQPGTSAALVRVNPAGRVPALEDGGLTIWDSLAICEYLAERYPEKGLWPADRAARAIARSVCAEMHSGFTALRGKCPMKVKERFPAQPLSKEVQADVDRIVGIWEDCRRRFGAGGRFLFGAFSIADAFYAPVVSRFRTYAIPISPTAQAYADAVWELPSMKKWAAGAQAENFTMARYEKK